MSVQLAPLLRGLVTETSGTDDATDIATVAAIEAVTHLILGVDAAYDIAVTAIKTIVVKHGTTTFRTFRWDFTNGPFAYSFPVALKADPNEAVSVELEASGSGGTTGFAAIWVAEK